MGANLQTDALKPSRRDARVSKKRARRNAVDTSDKKEKTPLRDALVVLLCLASSAFFLLCFYNNLNRQVVKNGEKPVGTITFKKNAAQRRFVDRALWSRVAQDSPIYSGDIIRTSELSEAEITFFDSGSTVDIAENTLIQIYADEAGLRVDMQEGGVQLGAGSGAMSLVSGGKAFNIQAGGVASAKDSDGLFGFAVQEGEAQVVNANGNIERLSGGGGIFLNADGSEFRAPYLFAQLPKSTAKILTASNTGYVVFLWKENNYTDGVFTRLEVAQDARFNNITMTRDIYNDTRAEVNISEGVNFWRLFPVDKDGKALKEASQNGKLTVIKTEAPNLLSPLDGEVLPFIAQPPAVRLQWAEVRGSSNANVSYKITVADNPFFDTPTVNLTTTLATQSVQGLGQGIWYWKVEPFYGADAEGSVPASVLRDFRISKLDSSLPPPILTFPANSSVVSADKSKIFTWQGNKEAESANIVISRNADLSRPVLDKKSPASYYSGGDGLNLEEGTYYWAVSQLDAAGNASSYSNTFSFTVSKAPPQPLRAPIIASPFNGSRMTLLENDARDVELRWQKVDDADFYRVTVRRDGGEPRETITKDLSFRLPITDGAYTWSVESFRGSDVASPSGKSAAYENRFWIKTAAAARLVSPLGGQVFSADAEIRALWTAGAPTAKARILVSSTADMQKPLVNIENAAQSVALPALPPGDYYWTVRLETSDGFPPSAASPLSFRVNRAVKKALLVSPADRAELRIADSVKPLSVTWSLSETARDARFILSTEPNPLADKAPIVSLRNPPKEITLPELQNGTYYWTIRAEAADGIDLSAETIRSFRIAPALPLPSVLYLDPPDGQPLQIEVLRDRQSIIFKWSAVPRATEYIFTLQREGASGENLARTTVSDTQFIFDDLGRIADGGTFIWKVTPQVRDGRGRVTESAASPGEARFSFSMPRPVRGEAHAPGSMYGTP